MMDLSKRGSVTIVALLLAIALSLSAGIYYVSENTNLITGLAISDSTLEAQTITTCNISVTSNIINIGHDYECSNEYGFIINGNDLTLDCQDHIITCVDGCTNYAGIYINGFNGTTIQNCDIRNFADGVLLTNNASNNVIQSNSFLNNSDGIGLNPGLSNNITLNTFLNSTVCGVNASANFNNAFLTSTWNNIWNNKFLNNSNGQNGCSDVNNSYNNWYLAKECNSGSNIIGGPCLGGNYWGDYDGLDVTGDKLGDTNVPHLGGGIQGVSQGDNFPLVNITQFPSVICNSYTWPAGNYTTDSGGEGLAVVCDNATLSCESGANFIGNGQGEEHQRGIEIVGVNNVQINGCNIQNFTYGIYIKNAINITIDDNTISNNNQTGIYIGEFTKNSTFNNNTLGNSNSLNTQSRGIWMRSANPTANGGGNNLITNNTIFNHTSSGIYLADSSDVNNISGNIIYNNTNGIINNQSTSTTIRNNSIYSNSLNGITLIENSDFSTIDGNSIYNNAQGILNNLSDATTFTNNNIYSNSQNGLYIVGSSNINSFGTITSATSNSFYNNTLAGLYFVDSSSDNPITGTYYNNSNGIVVYSSNPNIGRSVIYNNTNYGILLDKSTNIELDYLTVYGHSGAGIFLNGTNFTTVGSNEFTIYNNSIGIWLNNSFNNSLIFNSSDNFNLNNNTVGLLMESSGNNTISGFVITNSSVGLNITSSNDNLIYNNNFSSNTINAFDQGTNVWNITLTDASLTTFVGKNIIGGANLGGNYWSDYLGNDSTNDGIGDNGVIPFNSSANITIGGDFLPLINTPSICTTLTASSTLFSNVSVNGSCFVIGADNISLDFNGFTLTGNGSGIGVNISNYSNVVITNANIINFSTGIYADPAIGINITLSNISATTYAIFLYQINQSNILNNSLFNNTWAIYFNDSHNNTVAHNNITLNTKGFELTNSTNSTIYNNYFSNTQNALDDGSINNWNSSYSVGSNILNSTATNAGGNYWNGYTGKDIGGGAYPYNTSGDGIGDTQIPYSVGITGGDRLPLTIDKGGSISCNSITNDTVLTSSVTCSTGSGITIAANNVTLNCNGNSISGTGIGAGIKVVGQEGVIIRNCNVTNFYYGIQLENAKDTQIVDGNNINLNNFYGVYLYGTNDTIINGNTIVNDNNGVYIINSFRTNITSNTIDLNKKFYGIYAYGSPHSTFAQNNLTDNFQGIYLVNSDNTTISSNVINRSDVYSLFLHSTTNESNVTSNMFSNGQEGIRIRQSSNGNIFNQNTITGHSNYGVHITNANGNLFTNNTIQNNSASSTYNIYLNSANSTTFNNNSIINSLAGFFAISSNVLTLNNNTFNSTASPTVQINESTTILLDNNTIYNNFEAYLIPDSIINGNTILSTFILANSNNVTIFSNNVTYLLNITNSNDVNISTNNLNYTRILNTLNSNVDLNTLKIADVTNFSTGTIRSNDVDNVNGTSFIFNKVILSNISSNNIQNATVAIFMDTSSDNNTLFDNWVKGNVLGLNISSGSTNTFYNNYFENTQNVVDTNTNTWNTTLTCISANIVGGPCQGGNFYSNYYGLDNGANNRDQGDGIGDQPALYTIGANIDYLPLVLYVARQYFAPKDNQSIALTATGNVSGVLVDEEVVPNEIQNITYSNITASKTYLVLTGLFNESNVAAQKLVMNFDENKSYVNLSGVTGIGSTSVARVYHDNRFDAGLYICNNATELQGLNNVNSTCTSRINVTTFPQNVSNFTIVARDTYYEIGNITNTPVGFALEFSSVCGANLYHDVTFTNDVVCSSDSALNVYASDITIDFAGYSLTGNGSGIGVNISSFDDVTIVNANIMNFSNAIFVDPATGINISNSNISNNSVGISFSQINNSFITGNRIINNTLGLNLTLSYNNTIYNNFFNNTNNTLESGYNNTWNVSVRAGPNIIGGTNISGNFWHDFTGWDVDLDGFADTQLPYNNSGNLTGGDQSPLLEVGYIACGGSTIPLTVNTTLNRNLSATGICFNVTSNNVELNCAGYYIIGNGSGAGIDARSISGLNINHCTIRNFTDGIYTDSVTLATIRDNIFSNNSLSGIKENTQGANWTIFNNSFTNNVIGINTLLVNSTISNNTLLNNSVCGSLTTTSNSTLSGNNCSGSSTGFVFQESSHNNIFDNIIINNSIGINFTSNVNQTFVYNNFFNNTINVVDNSTLNFYNTTYLCNIVNYTNIAGGNCTGGNFWSDYAGLDNGNGTGAYNTTPWNISGNKVGDTNIPHNGSGNISGAGDYLPLLIVAGTTPSVVTPVTTPPASTGGGSSGSSSSAGGSVPISVSCTQDWSCGDWTECSNSDKTRTCIDQNSCAAQLASGDVDEIEYLGKPAESKSCESVEVIYTDQIPAPPSGAGDIPVSDSASPIGLIAYSSLALLAAFGGIYAVWEIGPSRRLHRRLKKASRIISQESIEALKKEYKGVYSLYLKVSEKKKGNYYTRVNKLRSTIEEQLKAEKVVTQLIDKSHLGSINDQKKNYLQLHKEYQKLAPRSQEKYYPTIVSLREKLEKGA
jgi:parallel beta-helix repeat protein